MLTEHEQTYWSEIAGKVDRAKAYLQDSILAPTATPSELFDFLSALRAIQGNLSNDVSFAATLMAKSYLNGRFGLTFDAAEKAQGAAGIDIDVTCPHGLRIVAEIKTTVPYQASDFGASQAKSFRNDFAKLSAAKASHKFLFVTDSKAFAVLLKPRYLALLRGVQVVNLSTGEERAA